MKTNNALKVIIPTILYLTAPIYGDSPKEFENLLTATFAPATTQAQSIAKAVEAFYNTGSPDALRYGDKIRLRHSLTGYRLLGSNKADAPQSTSKTPKPVAAKDFASWWIVKGPHVDEQRFTGNINTPVTLGSTLRLEEEGTGLNLHSKSNQVAPLSAQTTNKKQQVSLFGTAGIGNIDDNWQVKYIAAAPEIKLGVAIKLSHVATSGILHSDILRYPDGLQEVSCTQITDDNDWWAVEAIIPGNAPDLNIFYAVYGDLNSTDQSASAVITSKLDAITYNGALRLPVQPIPPQAGATNTQNTMLFTTLAISDPSPGTIKNLAVVYGANSGMYIHLAASEYDIISLPNSLDPKLFDLKVTPTVVPSLKVLYAIYGDLNYTTIGKNGGIGDPTGVVQNVTSQVQGMIKNNQIIFDTTPKTEIFNTLAKAATIASIAAQIASLQNELKTVRDSKRIDAIKKQIKALSAPETPKAQAPAPSKSPTPKPTPAPVVASKTPAPKAPAPVSIPAPTPTSATNKALLLAYQAGVNIYFIIIGEKQSAIISPSGSNQSTLIYTPPTIINPPALFVPEVGSAGRISVGSSMQGILGVYALSVSKDTIQRYDTFNLFDNPWTTLPIPTASNPSLRTFRDIGYSSDNTFCFLDSNGKAYFYNMQKQTLNLLPAGSGNESLALDFIAVGNARSIWAVDAKSKALYQYLMNQWVKVPNMTSVYVAAALDGSAVSISLSGIAYLFNGVTWNPMAGGKVDRVAMANIGTIWGISNGQLVEYTGAAWSQVQGINGGVANGFKEIAMNAAGTIFATTANGTIYFQGEAGFFTNNIKSLVFQAPKQMGGKIQRLQITGTPVISPNMTRARAIQQGKLVVNANAQTKAGKLAALQAKTSTSK